MAEETKRDAEVDFVIKDPPLKRLKQHLASISTASEPRSAPLPELSPNSLKTQLRADESLLNGVLKDSPLGTSHESVLERMRSQLGVDHEGDKADHSIDFSFLSDSFFDSEFAIEEKPPAKKEAEQEEIVFDDFDFDTDELDALQEDLRPPFQSTRPFERVKIVSAVESSYEKDGRKFQFPQKILECLRLQNGCTDVGTAPLKVIVRDDWLHCRLNVDSVINVIGPIEDGTIIVNNDQNYIITEPDHLINTTTISDAFSCLRRAVLSYRTKASIEDNKPSESLVCGSIVHELVEDAFRTGNYQDTSQVLSGLDGLIQRHIETIFCCERDEYFIRNKVVEMMQNFPNWCQMYLRKFPAIHAFVQDQLKVSSAFGKKHNNQNEKATICIPSVLDLEENIWSVMFGIKGKVDSTIIMKFKEAHPSGRFVHQIAPFELKTGVTTTSVSHRAQTLLYTLMLHDRYQRPVDFGLLFYISTGELIRIPAWRDEIRSIVLSRNRLAEELSDTDQLPAQITNEHLCKKCFQLDACVMYHRLAENGCKETSSTPSRFDIKTGHIPEDTKYAEFFAKWQNLVTLEESETVQSRSELWRLDADKRAADGRCFNDMKLVSCEMIDNAVGMNRFRVIFEKHKGVKTSEISLLTVNIGEGDPVVVSCQEPQQYALAVGFVSIITPSMLIITTDRMIKLPPGPEDCLEVFEQSPRKRPLKPTFSYRIDKDELTSGFGLLRNNVFKLFSAESRRLLELIVEGQPPRFTSSLPDVSETLLNSHNMWDDYCALDEYQRAAFEKITQSLDFLLVLGMPGTGKTSTISFVIQYLVQVLGKSVLISSHTHSAIDHISLKLQSRNVPLVRIGNTDKIDKALESSMMLCNQNFKTVSEVESYYSKARVVVCTSLGINHPIFMKKRFDFCVVDEASQLTLPACIGPLRLAQTFILVGDHYQLPPLVRSKAALKEGLGESLFKQLADTQPQAMVQLRSQYRMNEEIMLVANRLVYNNLLRCGSVAVAKQVLSLSAKIAGCSCCEGSLFCWLRSAIDPKRKVLFFDTDALFAYETPNGPSFHNEREAAVIHKIICAARSAGVPEEYFSLISPYRPQLKYLTFEDCPLVEVSTIDKYQGKDRECVIISLVRSNSSGNVGELLKDWQRLNVAFTRAKKKLILVGSARTVLQNPSFRRLDELISEQCWMVHLPSDALKHELKFE